MKKIKCGLFLIIGYPNKGTCDNKIEVPDNYKEACKVMNDAGWKKCGGINGSLANWGYFCPEHSKNNQFYSEVLTTGSI